MARPGPSAALIMELRTLICRVADEQADLHAKPSTITGDWDLDNPDRPQNLRKDDYLAVLLAAHLVKAAIETVTGSFTSGAMRAGADFAELGAAAGISRQAARQRILRETKRRVARLVGGPRDGQHATVIGTEREVHYGQWAGPWEETEGRFEHRSPPITVVYRAKYGSPDVFEFHHYENSEDGTVTTEWDRRPRVHQLARFWFTDSSAVLAEVRALDPKVRTPSSRVDLTLLEPLREALEARLGSRLSNALPERGRPSSTT